MLFLKSLRLERDLSRKTEGETFFVSDRYDNSSSDDSSDDSHLPLCSVLEKKSRIEELHIQNIWGAELLSAFDEGSCLFDSLKSLTIINSEYFAGEHTYYTDSSEEGGAFKQLEEITLENVHVQSGKCDAFAAELLRESASTLKRLTIEGDTPCRRLNLAMPQFKVLKEVSLSGPYAEAWKGWISAYMPEGCAIEIGEDGLL